MSVLDLTRLRPERAVLAIVVAVTMSVSSCTPTDAEETGREDDGSSTGAMVSDSPAEYALSEYPHPEYNLSTDELRALVSDLPAQARSAVESRPQYFLELISAVLDLPSERTVLVDKRHPLPPDYAPGDLIRAAEFPLVVNRRDLLLREPVIPDLVAMSTRARLDGVVLDLSSGYRSYDYQDALFKRHVRELGLEQATRESAEPGKSQHQLGTTIDFGSITPAFARTDAGRWLSENAWRYGFSLSYPRGFEEITGYMYESWHFRYLGRDATLLEREFFGGIQQTMLVFLDQNRAELERARS